MMASPQFWPPAAPAEIVGSPSWTSPLFPALVRLLQPFESNFDVLDFDSAFRVIQHAVGRPNPTPRRRLFVHHHSQQSRYGSARCMLQSRNGARKRFAARSAIRLLELRPLQPSPHRHVGNPQCSRCLFDATVLQKRHDDLVGLTRPCAALHRVSFAGENPFTICPVTRVPSCPSKPHRPSLTSARTIAIPSPLLIP